MVGMTRAKAEAGGALDVGTAWVFREVLPETPEARVLTVYDPPGQSEPPSCHLTEVGPVTELRGMPFLWRRLSLRAVGPGGRSGEQCPQFV